ncbi:MAG: chorismate mutase [Planctomycetota bacterium]|jgi:chorismate mutase/prephenate dehydratase|nr:chorismate mutase [Planctomycetota bacterium]
MKKLRSRIDEIDDAMLDLAAERFFLAASLGAAKKELRIPVYDPEREELILRRLCKRGEGKLAKSTILSIWREIFSASRLAQTRLKAAYLGPEGTFAHQAALARFGSSSELVAGQTIAAVFAWVKRRTVDFAILPVENTLQGVVGETVDLLGRSDEPLIIDAMILPIHFVFASRRDDLEGVRRIYSKREAFPQCSVFLDQPALANAAHVPATSTAEAARRAADDPEGAALSPGIAASLAGVPIRFEHVENDSRNKTRFLILGRPQPARTGRDQTSVFARARNVVGGLERLLAAFSERGINLTKIESRPLNEAVNFESWFYINFDGHIGDAAVASLIKEHDMVWLGSYRREDEGAPA